MIRIRPAHVLSALLLLMAASCAQVPTGFIPFPNSPPDPVPKAPGDATVPYRPAPDASIDPGYRRPVPGETATPAPWKTPGPVPTATPAPIKTPTPVPTSPPSTQPPTGTDLASLEQYIFEQTNAERAKVGAKALLSDPSLNTLARSRSEDMVNRNYFDHVTPDGKNVFDMLKAMNFSYSTAGENIAMNTYPESKSAVSAMQQWMNSSGHKANILNVKYGRIGVGAWKKSATGGLYYTQVFTN